MKAHILNTQENKIKRVKVHQHFVHPPLNPECRGAGLENEWINCHSPEHIKGHA